MKTKLKLIAALLLLSTINHPLSTAFAQGTTFTYQGRLNDGSSPANGLYDFTFSLYDSGGILGIPHLGSGVPVSNGLFTVTLDFGPGSFPGANRWLQIGVRTNGLSSFVPLSPPQM